MRVRLRWRLSCPLLAALFLAGLAAPAVGDDVSATGPITPKREVIKLFNGKDLGGLYVYMKDTKYADPRGVFSVCDGVLRVSGDGLGGLCTKREYRDYHMICEFRWGTRTWGRRKDSARDSGVLVHCTGPDGAYGGVWMASIEAQIIEGGIGDFIVVPGKDARGEQIPLSLSARVVEDRDGESVWRPDGGERTFLKGRVNWSGRDPDWKDKLGFRGKHDIAAPLGQWNRMDVICRGDQITIMLNGVVVNHGYHVVPSAGKLTIQTELAEIFIRRWELWPLDKSQTTKVTL